MNNKVSFGAFDDPIRAAARNIRETMLSEREVGARLADVTRRADTISNINRLGQAHSNQREEYHGMERVQTLVGEISQVHAKAYYQSGVLVDAMDQARLVVLFEQVYFSLEGLEQGGESSE